MTQAWVVAAFARTSQSNTGRSRQASHKSPLVDWLKVVTRVDELLEIDPADTRHMLREEIKRLFFAMPDIKSDDLNKETMNDFLQALDQASDVLYRIEKRQPKREEQHTEPMI